jgi:hypothetical protein
MALIVSPSKNPLGLAARGGCSESPKKYPPPASSPATMLVPLRPQPVMMQLCTDSLTCQARENTLNAALIGMDLLDVSPQFSSGEVKISGMADRPLDCPPPTPGVV